MITGMNVFFGIIAMLLIAVAGYLALYDSIPFAGDEDSLGIFAAAIIVGALTLTALSILAFSFGWWWFAPLMLVAFAIWQKISYSHWSWLVALGFLLLGLNTCSHSTSAFAWVLPFIGKILTIAATLAFIGASALSYREDHLVDRITDAVKTELDLGGETS